MIELNHLIMHSLALSFLLVSIPALLIFAFLYWLVVSIDKEMGWDKND